MKVRRYCQRLIDQYDADKDGQLNKDEWSQMEGDPRLADSDRDGLITPEEFANRVTIYGRRRKIRLVAAPISVGNTDADSFLRPPDSPIDPFSRGISVSDPERGPSPAARPSSPPTAKKATRKATKFFVPRKSLPRGLPGWFTSRDRDGDAQLSLAEYAADGTESAVEEFRRYDANRDGLLTPAECSPKPKPAATVRRPAASPKKPTKPTKTKTIKPAEAASTPAEAVSPEPAAEPTATPAPKQSPPTRKPKRLRPRRTPKKA